MREAIQSAGWLLPDAQRNLVRDQSVRAAAYMKERMGELHEVGAVNLVGRQYLAAAQRVRLECRGGVRLEFVRGARRGSSCWPGPRGIA